MQMKIWTAAMATALLSGCAHEPKTATPPVLEGQWQVEDINGKGVIDNSHLTLLVEGNRLSGSAGCNNFSGTVTQNQDAVAVSQMALTRKMCPPALMLQEQGYMQALNQVSKITAVAGKPWILLVDPDSKSRIKLMPAN
ncbi:META domain-containing protein [Alteromonas sp. C1M14]|uniref:META domain-containing protein n=1 Tax=Alteromonas sp. C1M14 TaxID=2841567 RepID=UPI001C08142B|nr:META domain-containing protein [Alteromonas sp. C1M14]MBU2979307.1 META domain-containing protein [Alteromonas sp. C1M14]